ncbi:hypothetical protein B7R22_14075 [Subtercola boreus]|uniref:Integrase catalytic domain-containing protein n=1 Tax=Subtercola boreus TaxID=120213 RepID=A0A3E0VUT6_9MICO|nr:hypothetical protein B7R22_14075 [Subtercola boreus]
MTPCRSVPHSKPNRDPAQRTGRFVDTMVPIAQRPSEADDHAIPGHWEGDRIIGTMSRSAIGTLVERSSRFVSLVHLLHDHTAETVRDGLVKTVSQLPITLRRSLTWDQGSEMSEHVAFRVATDMDVYFCDPASPWQRGSNENTNGLLEWSAMLWTSVACMKSTNSHSPSARSRALKLRRVTCAREPHPTDRAASSVMAVRRQHRRVRRGGRDVWLGG